MKPNRRIIWTSILLTLILLMSIGCNFKTPARAVGPHPGALAPNFTVTLVDGSTLSLTDLKGQPLVLNFWATWCTPCEREMPLIENVYINRAGSGVTVLAINFGEEPDVVTDFVAKGGYTFPIALDLDLALIRTYLVHGMPTTYFIDREGVIRQIHIGEMTGDLLQNYVSLIEEG